MQENSVRESIEQRLLELCERGVEAAGAAGASQVEVYAQRGRSSRVVFQKNDLDTATTGEEAVFGIRVIVDGRPGFATANNATALREVAAEAVALARCSPTDAFQVLPAPAPLPAMPALVAADLEGLDTGALARLGQQLLERTLALRDPRAPSAHLTVDSLDLAVHDEVRAVASSTGVRAAHRSAWAQGGIFGMAIDGGEVGSFSYDGDAVRSAAELEPALERAFGRFARHALGAMGARKGESFRGPILLPPETVESFLLGDLVDMLSASAVRRGLSPFGERLGERIAVPGFELTDGGTGLDGHPLGPFDREGQPRQRRALIADGVLADFLFDGHEAARVGRPSSGNALGGAGELPSIGLASLSLAAGTQSRAELEDLPRGIVVTRFSGSTDTSSGDFSGVVKGGFLIRDGERIPVRETTIAGNLWQALHQISGISSERTLFFGTRALPALRIEDVSVTAG